MDLALAKIFDMPWTGHTLSVRIEGFNVLNHVQFGYPSTNLSASNFGAIVGTAAAYSPRTLQLVLRYRY